MQIKYMEKQFFCKRLEIKNLGEHRGFYLRSDALLLRDAFENFRKMCIKIYELDPGKFLSALE